MQYVSLSQAYEYVQREAGISREAFDSQIRPRLKERRYGERVIRLKMLAINQALEDPSFQEKEGDMLLKRKTLSDAIEHVWETEWSMQKGARKQRRLKDQIINDIGGRILKKVDYNFLEDWTVKLRKAGLAEATIARRLSAVMKALKVAQIKGWISTKPQKPTIRVRNSRDRYLTRDEATELINAASEPLKWAVIALLDTGCRLSELTKVRSGDITEDGVIFKERKAGNPIKVPLSARARVAIRNLLRDPYWKRLTRNTHDPDKDLRDMALEDASSAISKRIRRLADSLGMKDVTAHTLRHTQGSWLAQAGYPMHKIQQFLGHEDITVTSKRYAHLAPTSLKDALGVIEMHESDNVVPIDRQRINDD